MKALQANFDQETDNKHEIEKTSNKIKKQLGFMTNLHLTGYGAKEQEMKEVVANEVEKTKAACDKYEVEIQYLTTMMQTVDAKNKTMIE